MERILNSDKPMLEAIGKVVRDACCAAVGCDHPRQAACAEPVVQGRHPYTITVNASAAHNAALGVMRFTPEGAQAHVLATITAALDAPCIAGTYSGAVQSVSFAWPSAATLPDIVIKVASVRSYVPVREEEAAAGKGDDDERRAEYARRVTQQDLSSAFGLSPDALDDLIAPADVQRVKEIVQIVTHWQPAAIPRLSLSRPGGSADHLQVVASGVQGTFTHASFAAVRSMCASRVLAGVTFVGAPNEITFTLRAACSPALARGRGRERERSRSPERAPARKRARSRSRERDE